MKFRFEKHKKYSLNNNNNNNKNAHDNVNNSDDDDYNQVSGLIIPGLLVYYFYLFIFKFNNAFNTFLFTYIGFRYI